MELAEMCRLARQSLGISQAKFANMVGTNQTEISFIERGFIPEDQQKIRAIKELYERTI